MQSVGKIRKQVSTEKLQKGSTAFKEYHSLSFSLACEIPDHIRFLIQTDQYNTLIFLLSTFSSFLAATNNYCNEIISGWHGAQQTWKPLRLVYIHSLQQSFEHKVTQ